MIKGFKDFILRGNVIDLAVAVVVGAAFTALVAAVTANLIQPVLNAFGGVDTGSIGFFINPSKPESYVNISAIIGAVITFLITALVVYFVFVGPMKKILDMAARRKRPIKADPTEVELLTEIRDLLRAGNAQDPGGQDRGVQREIQPDHGVVTDDHRADQRDPTAA